MQDGLGVTIAGLAAVGIALAIAISMPNPNYAIAIGGIVGVIALLALLLSPRLDITAAGLAFYLGCINGPLKLISSAGTLGSALQDVLIIAILLGVLLRFIASGQRLRLPPLSWWAIAFVAVVLLEALNPKTLNVEKVFAGFRDQLQFVPFFIFGYLLVRSKGALRKAFILLGVIALANGIVSTYQTRLSPTQAATWGSGYAARYTGHLGKTFKSEGVGRVRPTGLGDEAGAGGGSGIIAIAGVLALLAMTRRRRELALLALLLFGCIAAIATSLGRIELVGGLLTVLGYALLTGSAGRKARRPLRYLLVALAVAVPFGVLYVASLGSGTFSRYESLFNGTGTSAASYKENELRGIPTDVEAAPFGFGLGTAGPAASFGGRVTELLEGHNVSAETSWNYIVKEVGLPGLLVWFGTIMAMLIMAFTRVRMLRDTELQTYIAAVFAPVFAIFFMSFEGPASQSEVLGPFFWFALGVAAYWLAGPGWQMARRRHPVSTPMLASSPAG